MAELKRRAELIRVQTVEALKNAGMFFPSGAKSLLKQQADLMVDLAASLERLESLIDIGEEVEPAGLSDGA